MAKKTNPLVELSTQLLQALTACRASGTGYPPTLAELSSIVRPEGGSEKDLFTALGKSPCKEQVLIAKKKDPQAPLALKEDLPALSDSPALLRFVLHGVCTAESPLIALSKLKTACKLDKDLRDPFVAAVNQRVAAATLPDFVQLIQIQKRSKTAVPDRFLHDLRFPLPEPPEVVLSRQFVRVLESLQRLGGSSYPTTLQRLVELAAPRVKANELKAAVACEPFSREAISLFKDDPQTAVAFVSDAELLARHSPLLVTLLKKLRTSQDQAWPAAKLKKVKGLHATVASSLDSPEGPLSDAATLPPGVGSLRIGKKSVFFLLDDVRGLPTREASGAQDASQAGDRRDSSHVTDITPAEFAQQFDAAFDRLEGQAGVRNFVSLEDLRPALPVSREVFDAELRALRRAGYYTLSAAEGRFGIAPEQRDAAIVEDNTLFLHVSRKS